MIKKHIKSFLSGDIPISDALNYIVGYSRLYMYNNKYLQDFMRSKVKYMFIERKRQASECYLNGSCYACGCDTPALFFGFKGCKASPISPGPIVQTIDNGEEIVEVYKVSPCFKKELTWYNKITSPFIYNNRNIQLLIRE